MFGDMGKMMKQVAEMKSKMARVDKELKDTVVKGIAKGNTFEVEMTAKMALRSVKIADEIVGDKKRLEKDAAEAIAHALKQATETAAEKLKGVTGGMKIPGIN